MTSTPNRSRSLAAAVAIVVALGGGAVALAHDGRVDGPATARVGGERVPGTRDVVVVFERNNLGRDLFDRVDVAARRAGAVATPARTGSLGMSAVLRGGAITHAPPPGWLIPMVYTAFPAAAVGNVMGPEVSSLLDGSSVVLNEVTAQISGAKAGDRIELQAADGSFRRLRVAGVLPYELVGGADMAMTTDLVASLGATLDTRVVVWGIDDRDRIERELTAAGVIGRGATRVTRSWDQRDPDATLSTPHLKQRLGEPWYRLNGDGSVAMHPAWTAASLTDGRVLLNDQIRVRARCHQRIVPDLRAALAEIASSGLGPAIDVANANSAGGCYAPRFTRVSGQIGFLSRHAYGVAFDTNTLANCLGCQPRMHCDVVRVFRKHGFAWGGNFRVPDGMHFEWVGERRDQLPYGSNYCSNVIAATTEAAPNSARTWGVDVLAADEQW